MTPNPVALGLTLCDYVIVEERTRKISLIGQFDGLRVRDFPSAPRPFSVFARLTDGIGDGALSLFITHVASDELIYDLSYPLHFPDKLVEVRVSIRLNDCSFPSAGDYLFTLLVDRQWVAQQVLQVYGGLTNGRRS